MIGPYMLSSPYVAALDGAPSGLVGTLGVRVDNTSGGNVTPRTTANIAEVIANSGVYTFTGTTPGANGGYKNVWDDTAGGWQQEKMLITALVGPPTNAVSGVFSSYAKFASGLTGTVGVTIISPTAVVTARSVAGVVEDPAGSGLYGKALTLPGVVGTYFAVWDDGIIAPGHVVLDENTIYVVAAAAAGPAAPPIAVLSDLIDCTIPTLDDCEMYRGDTRYEPFTITHSDTGLPYDLTGVTDMWFTAKREINDPDPGQFQQTIANGKIVITSAAAGTGYVRIDPIDTVTMPDENITLLWDLQIKLPTGDQAVTTVARGTLTVVGDITRAI